jgi:hypothetical protein
MSYMFQDVYFPTVIVCNINQNRRSLFRGLGITNESRVDLLYKQFYSGMDRNLTKDEQEFIFNTATSEVMLTRFWPFLTTYLLTPRHYIGERIPLPLKGKICIFLTFPLVLSLFYPLSLYCEKWP